MDNAMGLGNGAFDDLDAYFDFPLWGALPFAATAFEQNNRPSSSLGTRGQENYITPSEVAATQLTNSSTRVGTATISTDSQQRLRPAYSPKIAKANIEIDSDASWAEIDEEEEWSSRLRSVLDQFRLSDGETTMTTQPLSSTQRRKVLSMCHLMNLSHMSIRNGRLKRVLIAKCVILAMANCNVWNPRRACWSPGSVDPLVVEMCVDWRTYQSFPFYARRRVLVKEIERLGLANPTVVRESSAGPGNTTLVVLFYDDPASACEITATKEFVLSHTIKITSRGYKCFPGAVFRTPVPIGSMWRIEPGTGEMGARVKQPDHAASYLSEHSAGDSSTGSNYSFVSGYESKRNEVRKRKRVCGGYVCHADDCFKTFDRECDRRKHEKIHSDERAHVCSECNKGFLWPKDLKRHQRRHHAVHDEELDATGAPHQNSEEDSLPEFDPLQRQQASGSGSAYSGRDKHRLRFDRERLAELSILSHSEPQGVDGHGFAVVGSRKVDR